MHGEQDTNLNVAPETVVISVGGSLIVPDEIDTEFLGRLRETLVHAAAAGRHFIILTGGGRTSRRYGEAAATFAGVSDEEVDEIGIAACQLNAHLLRLLFKDLAESVSVNPDLDLYAPGSSSDRAAVRTALRHDARIVVNLSNIDYVYTADPREDPSAERIEEISWSAFRKIIPAEFSPNLSSPFDPAAAREAEEAGIEVAVINGGRMEEFAKYLDGAAFMGTRICGE